MQVPAIVRSRAESLGDPGKQWLAGLAASVEHHEDAWSVQLGEVLTGGSESLVLAVVCEDGTDAVLKIGLPGSADLAREAHVYQLANGRGYARLIQHDNSHNSLLMERLGPPLANKEFTVEENVKKICMTLKEAWIPLAAAQGLMTGAEKAQWLIEFIGNKWDELGQPCNRRTIEQALVFAEERGDSHCAENSVLVHGDAHTLNTLCVTRNDEPGDEQYKFVDPDGLFAERACDLAVPMRSWNPQLLAGNTVKLARKRCDFLSELTTVDASAIWQWGFVERVSTGLVLKELGQDGESAAYLEVAQRLCA